MDSALTCILVLVSMLTTHTCEFTQKYQYSFNTLITDFYELIKLNVSVYKLQSLSCIQFVSQIFVGCQI
jgi:hypothetical protein